ncbi:MAG: hypothetical protein KatS3mg015_1963 [Fimbriimonadales bacterium]|nr:MAG: hypothetical protein KatS3mg015_1963 [Fimbriimonadales bacterium]
MPIPPVQPRVRKGVRRWESAGLRALTVGQLYDAAFGIYRKRGWELVRLTLIPSAFVFAVLLLGYELVVKDLLTTGTAQDAIAELMHLGGTLVLLFVLVAPPLLVSYALMVGVIGQWVAERTVGREPVPSALWSSVTRKLPTLCGIVGFVLLYSLLPLGIALLFLVFSALASDTFVAPLTAILGIVGLLVGPILGLIVLGRYAMAPVVALQENVGARTAIRRARYLSGEVTIGERVRIPRMDNALTGMFLVVLLLQLVYWASFAIPVGWLVDSLQTSGYAVDSTLARVLYQGLSLLAMYAAFVLLHPVAIAFSVLAYFDRRIRIEGLDIELLAADARRKETAEFEV